MDQIKTLAVNVFEEAAKNEQESPQKTDTKAQTQNSPESNTTAETKQEATDSAPNYFNYGIIAVGLLILLALLIIIRKLNRK